VRIGVEVVDDRGGRLRVGGELGRVHAEDREPGGCVAKVRYPGTHEVEDVAGQAELGVEVADCRDRGVIDVRDEARQTVEVGVRCRVGPVEEARREPVPVVHGASLVERCVSDRHGVWF
jgi:hypothetical protein